MTKPTTKKKKSSSETINPDIVQCKRCGIFFSQSEIVERLGKSMIPDFYGFCGPVCFCNKSRPRYTDERTCKHCGMKYSQKEVERIFGTYSRPAELGYCSAVCYTNATIEAK